MLFFCFSPIEWVRDKREKKVSSVSEGKIIEKPEPRWSHAVTHASPPDVSSRDNYTERLLNDAHVDGPPNSLEERKPTRPSWMKPPCL